MGRKEFFFFFGRRKGVLEVEFHIIPSFGPVELRFFGVWKKAVLGIFFSMIVIKFKLYKI